MGQSCSSFAEYFSDVLLCDDAESALVSADFVVTRCVLLQQLDELEVVGDDDHLKVFAFVELDESAKLVGEVDDVLAIEVCCRLIECQNACTVGEDLSNR